MAINLMIIGMGPHTQRVYLPVLHKYRKRFDLRLKLGIDLKEQEMKIKRYLSKNTFNIKLKLIERFDPKSELPVKLATFLTHFVENNDIGGVIIATEPLVHQAYAKWALEKGLHILMDKPISTRKQVVSDIDQAIGLSKDYKVLRTLYNKLQLRKETIFSVNVQRRYHVGHQKVISLIKEVADRFDAPVTSIQSTHADGQWRLPNEMVDLTYHSYCEGYGKCSHSGYHLFDVVYQYYLAGRRDNKYANRIQAISSFVQPRGFITQFNEKNYEDYFGEDYRQVKKRDDKALYKIFKDYGELDASILLRFMKGNDNLCNASINLLHNSFARRAWHYPKEDLYKGNGRVKHEYHAIQQGPFQCIQVHSYQSKDKHDVSTRQDYFLGGNNHFDIHVFRNVDMFGEKEKPLQIYQLSELDQNNDCLRKSLTHEIAKEHVVLEFINFIQGKIDKAGLQSNIDSHKTPVNIMSAVYQSNIQKKCPLVEFLI